jgi:hypothetical protein
MEFSKAQQEFQIRYYLWAASEWEKEINESFPNLSSFKSGSVWETYQFMRLLDKHEQLTLARALLKRFHRDAVKSLGENCSAEEEDLRRVRDDFSQIRQQYQFVQQLQKEGQSDIADFWIQRLRNDAANVPGVGFFNDDKSMLSQLNAVLQRVPFSFEEQVAVRKKAGEKFRFAGKRKLQNVITEKFKSAFGDQCTRHDYDDIGDPNSSFEMKCCGWILSTHFWYGRGRNLINYSHSLTSPTKIHHERYPEITAPVFQLAICISFSAWLGITSQIQWEYLFNEEVEATCDAVIWQCRHFFETAPKLLKGLEFENITAS